MCCCRATNKTDTTTKQIEIKTLTTFKTTHFMNSVRVGSLDRSVGLIQFKVGFFFDEHCSFIVVWDYLKNKFL